MKDYKNSIKVLIYIIMALITVYGALGYTADDYFKELKVNDASKAEAVFTLDNKAMLLTEEALSISFNEVCGKVNDYKILVKGECERQIPIYSIREVCYDDTITDNKTLIKTIEKVCYDEQYVSSYKTEYYECWEQVKSLDFGIKDYKIDADISMAKCDDGTFGYKVDWIPTFNTLTDNIVYDKWAWWNVSYTKKMPINCTNLDDGTPIVINGSNGFELDDEKQIVWTYCSGTGTALYYNNYSSYVVANDTAQLPMEVELGNGTSYNPSSVWDANYKMVQHNTNYNDSTSNNCDGTPTNMAQQTGKIGGSVYYNGIYNAETNSKVTYCADPIAVDEPLTIEVWFNYTDNDRFANLLATTGWEGVTIVDYALVLDSEGTTKAVYIERETDTAGANSGWVAGLFEFGQYIHYAMVSNNTHIMLYINGSPYYVSAFSAGANTGGGNVFNGQFLDGTVNGFQGQIDDLRLSNVARSGSYVNQTLFNVLGTSGYGDLGEIEEGDISHPPEFISVELMPSEVGHCFAVEFMFNDTDDNITEIYMNYSSGDCALITFDSEGIIFYADFNCCGNPYEMNIFNATATDEDNNSVTTDNFNWTYGNICPVLSPISGQTSWLNNLLNFTVNASDGDDDAITYYDNTSLFNITDAGQITHNTTDIGNVGNYSINITISDGYCNDSQVFNYEILLTEPVTISASPIPELDFSSLTSMVFLFILIFGYIGINILAFLFRSFAFVSLAFFIGIFIGFMLISFHAILGLAFIFLGIMVVMGFSRRR